MGDKIVVGEREMSVRSVESSVTVTITYTEEHTTFLRGNSSSVTVAVLPPYLWSYSSGDYNRHPMGVSWSWRRADGFTRSLPKDTMVRTRTDGKMYTSVPIETNVDSKVVFVSTSSDVKVDAVSPFGTEVSVDVDAKGTLALSQVQSSADGKVAFSSDTVDVNADGKLTFAYEEVEVNADAKSANIHLSDLHWVNEFISQLLPEVRSSSQVWMLPVRVSPHDRIIITIPSLPKKYVVVFAKGVLVHEYVSYWNYVGSSGEELPAVFQLNGNATRVRLINPTAKEAFVVAVAYKP